MAGNNYYPRDFAALFEAPRITSFRGVDAYLPGLDPDMDRVALGFGVFQVGAFPPVFVSQRRADTAVPPGGAIPGVCISVDSGILNWLTLKTHGPLVCEPWSFWADTSTIVTFVELLVRKEVPRDMENGIWPSFAAGSFPDSWAAGLSRPFSPRTTAARRSSLSPRRGAVPSTSRLESIRGLIRHLGSEVSHSFREPPPFS